MRFKSKTEVPVIFQSEAAECGLASIAMVATYYGKQQDLFSLRRRFAISSRGATVKGLREIATKMELNSRALRVELENVRNLALPCILHWNLNHFVVLTKTTKNQFIIHDPATGRKILDKKEFSKHFTGVAVELAPTSEFKHIPVDDTYKFRDLLGKVRGLKRGVLQAVCLATLLEMTSVALPFYSQLVIDESLSSADTELLTTIGIGFILLIVLRTVISAVRNWVITTLGITLNFQWLNNVFFHLLRLPQQYFESRHLSDVVSKFTSVSIIQRTITTNFVQMMVDGLLVLGTLTMMFFYSVRLTVLSVSSIVLYALFRLLTNRSLADATSECANLASKQQNHFYETIRGMQSVRLFNAAVERHSSWVNLLSDQFNAELKTQKVTNTYQAGNTLIFGIERILIIWLGAYIVLSKDFSIGMLFAFVAYRDQFSGRLSALIDKSFEFINLRIHCDRVADIVFSQPENTFEQTGTSNEWLDLTPSIDLRNVCFRYSPIDAPTLSNINLRIMPGECVAITGPSGGGKTTLIKIILGLASPTEGEVFIGGVSLNEVGLENYRNLVASVMQDDHLFSGTILENISFFSDEANNDLIELCAIKANIHSEIMAMPMKYNTIIGNIGSSLSGGQRQRILLARALYRSPKILVLDEATSHLDLNNERIVNEAISKMNLTRVFVAHRPDTIAIADRVVLVNSGVIAEDKLVNPETKNSDSQDFRKRPAIDRNVHRVM